MGGVSNVGPTGNNSGDSTRIVISGKKEETEINAFESYRQFRQQVQNEYKNYKNDVKKEYEEFRNNALKEYNSFREKANDEAAFDEAYAKALENPDNWKKYEAHEGIKYPIMNKPKEAPVYTPEDSVDRLPSTNPTEEVKDTKPAVNEEKPVQQAVAEDKKPVLKQISRNGVSGGYSITDGKNGSGFSLETNMHVKMQGEARKFFSPGFGEIKRDENGYYSYRGIKSKNYNVVSQKIQSASIGLSINNAIYNDLLSKKNAGTELTEAEQSFIKFHLNNIQRYGLAVDENGNLIEK